MVRCQIRRISNKTHDVLVNDLHRFSFLIEDVVPMAVSDVPPPGLRDRASMPVMF